MNTSLAQQDNSEDHLKDLFKEGLISGHEYHFRKKAESLGIKTYDYNYI